MDIADPQRFEQSRSSGSTTREVWLTMLVFGGPGAMTWAIRGTSGWGGIDGTVVPGITWGILWWYVCWRKGIDARSVPLWLGLGIALGGELGYGQYVSWIRGLFQSGDQTIPVAPWIGWTWFAICGIGWGAPGGIILGWALAGRQSAARWLARITIPVGVAILTRLLIQVVPWLFFPNWQADVYGTADDGTANPTSAAVTQNRMMIIWFVSAALAGGVWLVSCGASQSRLARGAIFCGAAVAVVLQLVVAEWLFFPGDQLGLFFGELDRHAGRTVYTNSQNIMVVGWWIGALIVAGMQRDRLTLVAGLVIGGGFGLGFPLSAIWCLGYGWAPELIDWWKMWELQSGLHLGLLYTVMLYWWLHRADDRRTATDRTSSDQNDGTSYERWCRTLATAASGVFILWWMSRDEFPVVGALLAGFLTLSLVAGQAASGSQPTLTEERHKGITFVYAVFLLLFMMTWGMSTQLGILLGLYDAQATDQYAWPVPRMVLFAPVGILLSGVALWKMWTVCRSSSTVLPMQATPIIAARMVDLMTFAGVVGAVSIWPSKIGAAYAVCLAVSLFAFTRLNHRFDRVDRAISGGHL